MAYASGRPSQENTELTELSRLGIINGAKLSIAEPHRIYILIWTSKTDLVI